MLGCHPVAPTIVLDDKSRKPKKAEKTQELLQSGIAYALGNLAIGFQSKKIGAPRAIK